MNEVLPLICGAMIAVLFNKLPGRHRVLWTIIVAVAAGASITALTGELRLAWQYAIDDAVLALLGAGAAAVVAARVRTPAAR